MESQEKTRYLITALKDYQSNFNSSAYQTMGFSLVAAGWLMTSKEARGFLHANQWLAYVAIGLLIVSFFGYWWMAWRVHKLSQNIYQQLQGIKGAEGLYEHYLLSQRGVLGYIGMQGLASLFIVLVVVAAAPIRWR